MFDIEIFRYEIEASSIRLRQMKSFVGGKLMELGDNRIDVALGLEREGKDWAFTKAFHFLGKRLPCRRRTGVRRDRGVILTDVSGFAAIAGLPAPALMILATMTSGSFDRQFLHCRDEEGGRPMEIDTSTGRVLGYLSPAGMLDVLRVDPVVSSSRETAWVMSALKITSEHHAEAPASMRTLVAAESADQRIGWSLQVAFWRDVVPTMADPFVRERRLILGQSGEDVDVYAQPAPTLTFRAGSADELVQLLDSYFILFMAGSRGAPYVDAISLDDNFDVNFTAKFGDSPLKFIGTTVQGDRDEHPVIALILEIMQPEGAMLVGGPRLSEAEKAPALVTCEISGIRYGFSDGGPADGVASAHELLVHATRLIEFLDRHGVPDAESLVGLI